MEKFITREWAELISKPITIGAQEQKVFNHANLPVVKDELSITLRLKLQDYASDCPTIFHKGTDDLIRTPGLGLSENKLYARFTGNWDNNAGIMRVSDELLLQKWYHIAYTLSDPEKRLDIYVDGEWVGYYSIQDVKKQRVIFNDGPLHIGQAFSRDGFNGEISNVHYFNWRLTPGEIKKDIFTGLRKNEEGTIYYIVSKGNPELGLSFDDESFNDESSDDESFEDESFDDESFDKKSLNNDSTILKLRPFKNNINAQWKILRINNSDDYSSLADKPPIRDVILINKGTGKSMKYRNQVSGTEITQVDLAEADNSCILWTIGTMQCDGNRNIRPNNNEFISLDGWTGNLVDGCEVRLHPIHGGSNQMWTFQQVPSD
ncbi:19148_t:CDS:2 [Gigaspora margarita]|uniref:19148_t:CDS:1 n=1 Tax=Gigaspora margarita TaxID=4874 RepID=A0ABN7W0G6_GIGMA|nr:19148_t:CDS:2 [Gigaspora margarita]